MRLGDAGRDRADSGERNQLHGNPSARIGVLQVVNELRQVFNRVDIVVRRRRNQPDAWRGEPDLRNPGIHLVTRQLAAFSGLGALRHFDLEIVGADEVLAGDAKARRRDLFDGAAARIAVRIRRIARRIFAAFTGVRLSAEPVHRDGERLVRLLADRAVRHCAGGEAPDDLFDRLDLVKWHRFLRRAQLQKPAERRKPPALIVDELRVLLEDRVLAGPRGVLQLEHRVRIEQVILPVTTPLVFAAFVEVGLADGPIRVRALMSLDHFLRDYVDADAADARGRPREVLVDERRIETDRFEDLRAAVALQRRDTHLRHDLQNALVERVDVVLHRLSVRDAGNQPVPKHVVERLEGKIWIDDAGAVAQEQRAVMHFAGVARLDHEAAVGACALEDEMVVHAGRREQARDRSASAVGSAIRQDQDRVARFDGGARLPFQVLERLTQAGAAPAWIEEHRQGGRLESGFVDVTKLRRLGVVDHRVIDLDLPARFGPRIEEIALRPDGRSHRRHQLFADRVERRICDLREDLREIVIQETRLVREDGKRRVGAHRTNRFFAARGHRCEQQTKIFLRIAEGQLATGDRLVARRREVRRLGEIFDVHQMLGQPAAVRVRRRELALDFIVGNDAALRRVDEEDPTGMQSFLDENVLVGNIKHADFGRHDDQVVLRHVVPRRPQAIAVEYGADQRAIGERDRRRAVPWLHERRVIFVKRLELGVHGLVRGPRLRNHHQDGVRQRPPRHVEELEHVIERRRIAAALADDRQNLAQILAEKI